MGDPMKVVKLSLWMVVVPAFVMFILQVANILEKSVILYFILLGLTMLGIGIQFVPINIIGLEVMDYGYYKTNREMNGLNSSVGKFIMKVQIALSSAVVGTILIAISYIVNSETDTYIGELSAIPGMLDWFIVVSALVPVILSLITLLIFRYYPITLKIRAEMTAELERRKMEGNKPLNYLNFFNGLITHTGFMSLVQAIPFRRYRISCC
jgi:Na+/melibiose symporter-like transporter